MTPPAHLRTIRRAQFTAESNSRGSVLGIRSTDSDSLKSKTTERDTILPSGFSYSTRFKILWKKYGVLSIGTYLGIYAVTLSSIFLALDNGVFTTAAFGMGDPHETVRTMAATIEHYTGYEGIPNYLRENPRVGTFALGWVMTKFTEPVRIAATVVAVPSLAKFFASKQEREQLEAEERAEENANRNKL
jgi:hypothetical protein